MLLWDEMWGQAQLNQLLLTKLCDVTPWCIGDFNNAEKTPKQNLRVSWAATWGELRGDLWNSWFQPPQPVSHVSSVSTGAAWWDDYTDLCCSRRNRSSMSRRFSSAARPGNLPVRTANFFHAWPAPKGCAAGLGNEKCHLQLCIFSSSSIMQIPPPQICSKCFVFICRSTTNLLWSNINMGSMEWCIWI